MSNNTPIFTTRDRLLSASCFMKIFEKDGKEIPMYSICLQRSYKKKGEDNYTREQINLMPDDLLKLARLCYDSYGLILAHVSANRPQKTEYPAQEMDISDDIPF